MAVIIAVSMVSAIGGIVFNTMPLVLTSAGEAFGFSPKALGTLTTWSGAGFLLGTLTAPFWVDKVNWKMAAIAIWIGVILSFILTSRATGATVYASFALVGFVCSLAIAMAMRVLANMPDPERAYGTRLTTELWLIAGFSLIFPVLFIAPGGFSGAMYGLAIFAGFLGLGSFLMPARHSANNLVEKIPFPTFAAAGKGWVSLGIFLIYLVVNVGLFYFLYQIGIKFEPSPEATGVMFAGLKWLGGVAGAIGAIVGARAGLRMPHLVALILLLIGVAGLFLAQNFTTFMISSWIWEFGFTLGCLYQTTAITRGDPSNKLVVLVPAAFGISMLVGGKIAGQLLEGGSATSLYALVVAVSLIPAIYHFTLKGRGPAAEVS